MCFYFLEYLLQFCCDYGSGCVSGMIEMIYRQMSDDIHDASKTCIIIIIMLCHIMQTSTTLVSTLNIYNHFHRCSVYDCTQQ